MRIAVTDRERPQEKSQSHALPTSLRALRIGRDQECEIVLPSSRVAARAALIEWNGRTWRLEVLDKQEVCTVDNDELLSGESKDLHSGSKIEIEPFELDFFLDAEEKLAGLDQWQKLHAELVSRIHLKLNQWEADERKKHGQAEPNRFADEYILLLEEKLEELTEEERDLPSAERFHTDLGRRLAGLTVRGELVRRFSATSGRLHGLEPKTEDREWRKLRSRSPRGEETLETVLTNMRRQLGLDDNRDPAVNLQKLEEDFWPSWQDAAARLPQGFERYFALRQLKQEIKDLWYGLGPLEDLLQEPAITDILVNGPEQIYVMRGGFNRDSGRSFVSQEQLHTIIKRIAGRVNRQLNTSEPMVDARLPDGSRVNAVIDPVAIGGPYLSIRRFPARPLAIEDLQRHGALTAPTVEFLRAAVLNRRNILIAGGTGAGKTTLLNCLSRYIPDHERIVTIEDTAELQLQNRHVVRLERRQKNLEGKGGIEISALVVNALRMQPNRIILGECRGREALDMLQAMNTGHDGSMTTVHANTPADVVRRLEVMVQQHPESNLPVRSIHQQIASAIDLIVQLRVLTRGGERFRGVAEIAELTGLEEDGVRIKPIFSWWESGAELRSTGYLPTFIQELIEGKLLDLETFMP